ncbi:MAG: hypothetical protein M3Y45_00820, partial [Actinomycetota bacterium]|nr:hypothetical protein [Actinomycetota bacterium]
MHAVRNMKQPRLATILAALVLFIVLGGSATAASGLINGKTIKKGTITAKQIKTGTITKSKLKPATVKALKGQKGAPGTDGAPGKDGVVSPVFAAAPASMNLPANTELGVQTLSVPAGKYAITATARVFSTGTSVVGCNISTSSGEDSESATWSSPVNSSRTTLPLQMVTTSDTVTSIAVGCHPGNSPGSAQSTILAIPV